MRKSYLNENLSIKRFFKIYILIVIPVIIAFVYMHNIITENEIQKNKELMIEIQKQKSETLSVIIEHILKELKDDLNVLRYSGEVNNYVEHPEKPFFEDVESMFLRFARNKEKLDQIRILDSEGKEVIRVNNINGVPVLVEKDKLQDKSSSMYFSKTREMNDKEIYVSGMDLNIENNKIEFPLKPIIRIATPLYNKQNKFTGVLIINFLGEDILDNFSQHFSNSDPMFIDTSLINKDGYYLYNKNTAYTFGFMFEDGKNKNITVDYPEIWEMINSEKSGYYEHDGTISVYINIDPLHNIGINNNSDYSWTILSCFSINNFPVVQNNVFLGMNVIDILTLSVICVFIFIFVAVYSYLTINRKELDIATMIARETNDAVVITDTATRILYVNKAFEKITGYFQEEVLGLKTNAFKSGKHSTEFYKKMWECINSTGYWHGELWDRAKNNLLYPKELSIIAVKGRNSHKVEKYIGISSDLTAIKEGQKHATHFKNYNLDTDLPNEILLRELLEKSINNTERKLTVVCFSITNYTRLLISNNHDQQLFINGLIANIKQILHPDDFIAQISKSIFVLGLCDLQTEKDVNRFLDLFLSSNKQYSEINNTTMFFDIKAGISIYPDNSKTAIELINNAHIALDHILTQKDKSYLYYSFALEEQLRSEEKMNQLLRTAVINNELSVYYQPQVNSVNNRIVGAEALMRWNNPELGAVSPDVFIPIAEKTGQIINIGYWLIEQVFMDIAEIKKLLPQGFKISVNISPLQFKDNSLVAEFAKRAKKYDLILENFEIEITESIFMGDINLVNEKLARFKERGVSVAIDDFGTGFSSLSYLKKLLVDKIKIDRSFIKDYPETDKGEIAQVITNITRELGLNVITEGAETYEQIAYLKSVGCDCIQGYYYSRPLPLNEFIAYVNNNLTEND